MSDSQLDSLEPQEVSPKDEQITRLEKHLEAERDGRKEDRFLFLLTILIAIDVHIFGMMETWAGVVAILFLELIGVIVVARRLRVDEVEIWFNRLAALWESKKNE